MNKTMKTILIIITVLAVIFGAYYILQRQKQKKSEGALFESKVANLMQWIRKSDDAAKWREDIEEKAEAAGRSFEDQLRLEAQWKTRKEMGM